MDNLIYLTIIAFAVLGFGVASYIHCEKRRTKPMVCPFNMRCDKVLYSRYSQFLGVPLDIVGMFYYFAIALSYSVILFVPVLKNPLFVLILFIMSISGFIFSFYLVFIQAIRLKEWCSWCLMSAGTSTMIFFLATRTEYISSAFSLLAAQFIVGIVIIYILALAIGVGVTTIYELLFFRFLSDLKISEKESLVLHTMRQLIWTMLTIIILANYSFSVIDPQITYNLTKFNVRIVLIAILVVINLFYNVLVSSRLTEVYATREEKRLLARRYLKRLAFLFGFLSLVSWYSLFILEMIAS